MIESVLADTADKMDKAVSVLKEELAGVRTGRATPALLSRLTVDYYGRGCRSNSSPRSRCPSRACW